MRHSIRYVSLLLLVAGCTALGIQTPQSLDQKIAYAAQINTAVLTASTAALKARQIGSDEHEQVIKLSEQAKALTDSARLLSATDSAQADAKLQLATVVLTNLQTYLNARKRE